MKKLIIIVSLFVGLSSCKTQPRHSDIEAGWKYMETSLDQINAPVFPDRIFNILDYGVTTGGDMCTEAFRLAIEACHQAGGGRVFSTDMQGYELGISTENVKIIDCHFNNIKKENVLEFVNELECKGVTINGQAVN
jgi:hypothetical protein